MTDRIMKSVTSQETWRGDFQWEIQEIDTLLRPGECEVGSFGCLTNLTSRDFTAGQGTPNESTWQLTIRNVGTNGKSKPGEFMCVNLNLVDAILLSESDSLLTKKNFTITCSYIVSVGGTSEQPYLTKQHGTKFYIQKGGQSTDIPLPELFEKTQEIFPNNTLLITVKIAIIIGTTNQSEFTELRPVFPISSEENEVANLSDSLATLLSQKKKFTDVTLSCQNQNFPCHKAILAARSSVFEKMLDIDVEVPPPSVIEVEDTTPEVLEIALKYIYTGKIDLPKTTGGNNIDNDDCEEGAASPSLPSPAYSTDSSSILTGLLSIAEKYELVGLKAAALITMFSALDDSNAGAFAVAIHQHNAGVELKCLVMDYCQKRHSVLIKNAEYKKNFLAFPDAFFVI